MNTARDALKEAYGDIETFRFSARPGSNLRVVMDCAVIKDYLDTFRDPGNTFDLVFASIIVGFLENNVPLRTVRIKRTYEGKAEWYQEDNLVGTWWFMDEWGHSRFLCHEIQDEEGDLVKKRWYEHIPGTMGWCRRPDQFKDLEFAIFLVPLAESPEVMRPTLGPADSLERSRTPSPQPREAGQAGEAASSSGAASSGGAAK